MRRASKQITKYGARARFDAKCTVGFIKKTCKRVKDVLYYNMKLSAYTEG